MKYAWRGIGPNKQKINLFITITFCIKIFFFGGGEDFES